MIMITREVTIDPVLGLVRVIVKFSLDNSPDPGLFFRGEIK